MAESTHCENCGANITQYDYLKGKCSYCGSLYQTDVRKPQAESKQIDPEMQNYIRLHNQFQKENEEKFISKSGEFKHPGSILDQE